MRDYFVERELRDALLVLLTAVGVVLLIVCVTAERLATTASRRRTPRRPN